jgi:hypothetical protein
MAISFSFGLGDPVIDVEVRDGGNAASATALLDSGCEMTGISSTIATRLSLVPIGSKVLAGTTGALRVDTYAVDLDFAPAGLTTVFSTWEVFEIQGSLGVDVVIGRDIICHGTPSSQLILGPGGSGTLDL